MVDPVNILLSGMKLTGASKSLFWYPFELNWFLSVIWLHYMFTYASKEMICKIFAKVKAGKATGPSHSD